MAKGWDEWDRSEDGRWISVVLDKNEKKCGVDTEVCPYILFQGRTYSSKGVWCADNHQLSSPSGSSLSLDSPM